MIGSLLTNWTIRLALVGYVAVFGGEIFAAAQDKPRWMRWVWTVACLLFLAHVACAFHFFHHWSHAEAFENTAQRTGELIGWEFGAGIYFSYGFAVLWTADALWWWLRPAAYAARGWWLSAGVHSYMFFIAFNGAVVFEDGPTRWWGGAVSVGLVGLLVWRILSKREPTPCRPPAPKSPT